MRILFMADVPPDPNAGASGTELRTIEALRAQGHEVDAIWAPDLGRRIEHGNLHYLLELPRTYRRSLSIALARKRYDVVHVNQPHGWLAAKWLRNLDDPPLFVHRSHGLEPHVEEVVDEWRERYDEGASGGPARPAPLVAIGSANGVAQDDAAGRAYGNQRVPGRARPAGGPSSFFRRAAQATMHRLLTRHMTWIARFADGHIVSTTLDRDYLIEHYDVPIEKIAVIPQAAPAEYTSGDAPPMTPERLRRVLFVGQFAFFKAPMIAAEAMRRLADRDRTWVCAKKDHDAVRALAGPDVHLLDWMTAAQLRDVYDAHGVLLFPSFIEGFGKVFLEGMSRGMCVVASDTGGAHDVIEHGRSGVLVPVGDAEAMADAVRALELERAEAMSRAAAEAARRYSWERVARETAAFYDRLMRNR